MLCTTLGYIEQEQKFLMIHRIKKKNDISKEKWIGVGGKLEEGETPLQCMVRECKEETGLDWHDPVLKGIVTFNYQKTAGDEIFCEQMFLFSGSRFSGSLLDCDEGELEWVGFDHLESLNLWKGDLLFFALLEKKAPFFFLEVNYLSDQLVSASLNSLPIDISFNSLSDIRFPCLQEG